MTVPSAQDYLTTTRAVLAEARTVQELLVADPDAAELALDDLVAAATRQDTTGDAALRFTSAEPLEPAGEEPETTEEFLVGALAELHVASVLMATGHAAGEGGAAGDQELLARAVGELEGTLDALDRERAASGRLGFVGATPSPRQSPDAATALTRLRADLDDMVGAVMKGSAEVVSEMVGELGKLVPDRVTDAMARIGGELVSLPKIGRIVRIGLRKLEKVLNMLSRLISEAVGDRVTVQLQGLWDRARSGELVVSVLDDVLDVEGARRYVEDTVEITSADTARIDLAADELAELRSRFDGALKTVKAVAEAASLALVLAAAVALVVAQLSALLGTMTAVVCLLITGVVILLGMDYLDSRLDLGRVEGVRTIISRLAD